MTSTHLLARRRALATLAASVLMPVRLQAQTTPLIRVIVNTTPGSAVDAVARSLQPVMAQVLGATMVIENQAGASGLVGLQSLARAPADGRTIGFASVNLVIFPSVMKSVPFDVKIDFSPIAMVGDSVLVLVANAAKVAATNARAFASLLKAKPSAFNYASSGTGTILHLATELFLQEAGLRINHIPYKGAAPMLLDTVSGQTDFCTAALSAALPHIKSGAVRPIGVCTTTRAAMAPDIPTFQEQGMSNVVARSWAAYLGPRGMPRELVKRYHDAVAATLSDSGVEGAMAQQAMNISLQSPEETQATIQSDFAKYARLVKTIGLEPS